MRKKSRMQGIQKKIACFCAAALLLQPMSSASPVYAAEEDTAAALAAYRDLLSQERLPLFDVGDRFTYEEAYYTSSLGTDLRFGLAYIDDDDFPELIVQDPNWGIAIFTYDYGGLRRAGDLEFYAMERDFRVYERAGVLDYWTASEGTSCGNQFDEWDGYSTDAIACISYYEDWIDEEDELDYWEFEDSLEEDSAEGRLVYGRTFNSGSAWFEGDLDEQSFLQLLSEYVPAEECPVRVEFYDNTPENRERMRSLLEMRSRDTTKFITPAWLQGGGYEDMDPTPSADTDTYTYSDGAVAFSVPWLDNYTIYMLTGDHGPSITVDSMDPNGSYAKSYVSAWVLQIDASLLGAVAEQGTGAMGFEALFQNNPSIASIDCVKSGAEYEFHVYYTMADDQYVDYYRFLNPSGDLWLCVCYRCVPEVGGGYYEFFYPFYSSVHLLVSASEFTQTQTTSVLRYLYWPTPVWGEGLDLLTDAARIGRAYTEGRLGREEAAAMLEAIRDAYDMAFEEDSYAAPAEAGYQITLLIEYVRAEKVQDVQIIVLNILVVIGTEQAEAIDFSDLESVYAVWSDEYDDAYAAQEDWVPADAIWYWAEDMQFTYTGSWYVSYNDFSVYMPTTWTRTPVTTQTLSEGIELQMGDAGRGLSLSVYCGYVDYEPTLEGIYQYLVENGYQNVRYAVCNGSRYAVQFDSPWTPERELAFPIDSGEVVTIAVYCENAALREAVAFDMFSSVY